MPTTQEDDWQAEDDARILTDAEAIKGDTNRLGKAQKAAKRMLKEQEIKAKAMKAIASGKPDYSKSPEPPKE